MMGLPDGWITQVPGLTRNQQLKALGNGVVPQQAAHALRALLTGSSATTSPETSDLFPTPRSHGTGGMDARGGARGEELLLPGIAKRLAQRTTSAT